MTLPTADKERIYWWCSYFSDNAKGKSLFSEWPCSSATVIAII